MAFCCAALLAGCNAIFGVGDLRIDGSGVAWLPESLIEPDLARNILVRTGRDDWTVDLEIRLYRNQRHQNRLTHSIWSFLELRQSLPLH